MKNLLYFVFLNFVLLAFSQEKSNAVFLSITGSPFPTNGENSGDFGLIGKTNLEFFISEKVSFSGSLFLSNNTLIKNQSNLTINSYGFIPSIQYYFLEHSKLNIFGQAGFGFGLEDLTRKNGQIENSALTIFTIGAGINYKLADKLYLQLSLPYFKAQNITINENAASGVAAFLGFNFQLK